MKRILWGALLVLPAVGCGKSYDRFRDEDRILSEAELREADEYEAQVTRSRDTRRGPGAGVAHSYDAHGGGYGDPNLYRSSRSYEEYDAHGVRGGGTTEWK